MTFHSDPNNKTVLIKTAPPHQIKNEVEAIELCQGHKSVRPLIDVIDEPQSLVLELLNMSLYDALCMHGLERRDTKRAVKTVLEALSILHAHNRAHTGELSYPLSNPRWLNKLLDIKPNNILANKGVGDERFSIFQLGDLGDSVPVDTDTNDGGHIISAPIYRAPEVMFNVKWTVAVDIWSLGTTVRFLYFFKIT